MHKQWHILAMPQILKELTSFSILFFPLLPANYIYNCLRLHYTGNR